MTIKAVENSENEQQELQLQSREERLAQNFQLDLEIQDLNSKLASAKSRVNKITAEIKGKVEIKNDLVFKLNNLQETLIPVAVGSNTAEPETEDDGPSDEELAGYDEESAEKADAIAEIVAELVADRGLSEEDAANEAEALNAEAETIYAERNADLTDETKEAIEEARAELAEDKSGTEPGESADPVVEVETTGQAQESVASGVTEQDENAQAVDQQSEGGEPGESVAGAEEQNTPLDAQTGAQSVEPATAPASATDDDIVDFERAAG